MIRRPRKSAETLAGRSLHHETGRARREPRGGRRRFDARVGKLGASFFILRLESRSGHTYGPSSTSDGPVAAGQTIC
jgi:hypothetical protein